MRLFFLFFAFCAMVPADVSPQEIVRRSAANEDRAWLALDNYIYTQRDETRRLDSHGRVKSDDVEISKMISVNRSPVEQTVSHNGNPPTAAQRRKDRDAVEKARNETPAARAVRLRKERENSAFISEVPQAFDFRLIGEEDIHGRPAYVFEATPKPGFHSRTKYGKMFAKAQGKLWVDKEDLGWVKVDASVTDSFSVGFFLARVQPGSHILFEQTRVTGGLWLPKQVEVRASARVFLFFGYHTAETITYSDYLPAQPPRAASSGENPQ